MMRSTTSTAVVRPAEAIQFRPSAAVPLPRQKSIKFNVRDHPHVPCRTSVLLQIFGKLPYVHHTIMTRVADFIATAVSISSGSIAEKTT